MTSNSILNATYLYAYYIDCFGAEICIISLLNLSKIMGIYVYIFIALLAAPSHRYICFFFS